MHRQDDGLDDFARLHRLFTFHMGVAVALAWMTALYASLHAPWVRNIRPLVDPQNLGTVESTWSFLFGMPVVMTVAWVVAYVGRDLFRHVRMVQNQLVEFGFAAVTALVLFYLSIDRAVAAILLAGS